MVRGMHKSDLHRVCELSVQLGYSISTDNAEDRFLRIDNAPGHVLFVADKDERVIGWIHVFSQWLIESEPYAEIGGLVVDHAARRMGVGRVLVLEARRWALEQGLKRIRVRSNVLRQEAHQFYPALGFVWLKTQHNYELQIP